MAVAFGAAGGPVCRPCTAEINELQAAGVRCDEHVGGLDIAVGDLQTSLQMADSVGEPIDQSHGLCGLDRGPASFANILKIIRQTDAFGPCQSDVNLMTLFLPFYDSWKRIRFESAQHAQKLLGGLAGRQ